VYQNIVRRGILPLLVVIAAAVASAQGLYWESTSSGKQAAGHSSARSYAVPKMFKNVDGDRVVLIRLDRRKLYSIDLGKKTYWEMTFAEMERMMKRTRAQMEQVQKQMRNLSPEQKRMVEEQMGKGMADLMASGGKVKITASNEVKTVSGYSCTKYIASHKGNTLFIAWATKGVKGFTSLRKDWDQFYTRLLSLSPATSMGFAEAFRKIDGFPMEMEAAGRTTVVTKVEQRPIPTAEFELPSGLTQQQNPLLQAPATQ
jgi:hypothetical protein